MPYNLLINISFWDGQNLLFGVSASTRFIAILSNFGNLISFLLIRMNALSFTFNHCVALSADCVQGKWW